MKQREIKFRVWDKTIKSFWNWEKICSVPEFFIKPLTAPQDTVLECMQYTGLKDKNGKEIYEGDYLIIDGGADIKPTAEVIFIDGCFCIDWPTVNDSKPELKYYASFNFITCEVIGNIYENPELISK